MDLSPRHPAGFGVHGALCVAVAFALSTSASADEISIQLDTPSGTPESSTVTAVGLDERLLDALGHEPPTIAEWKLIFPIYTYGCSDGSPPVAGTWTIGEKELRFHPRYPFVPGLGYVARLDVARLRSLNGDAEGTALPVETFLSLPREEIEPSTIVSQIYPTASELPENLLKLYLHFSAPMGRGEAYEHIRLLDADGHDSRHVFLEVGEELWDGSMRRLTLFFDPGRIKRGLRPHLEAGPPLTEGASYQLVIDPAWRDADGLPLAQGFTKKFTVIAADRQSPDLENWQVDAPVAGTREPVQLTFAESLDHGLLQRVVRVLDTNQQSLGGRIEITSEERSFRFFPEQPWRSGDYTVTAESILEDLAGNNLSKVFDLDIRAPVPSGPATEDVVTIAFTVPTAP